MSDRILRRALRAEPAVPFRPQRKFLSLISTGDRYAIATRGRFAARGVALWYLKDWIDRRWMQGYKELPPASRAPPDDGSNGGLKAGTAGTKVAG
jgi:selenide,water dikinase